MKMEKTRTKRIQSLESLRFIMALIVMQSHLRIADWSFKFFYNGNLAVIFFFILSGFGSTYECFCNPEYHEKNSRWSLFGEYKFQFGKMKKIYFWYMLFILISLPWQFRNLVTWHNTMYATIGTLATILITPTMLQSAFGFYQASCLGLGAYWFVSTLFILNLVYPLLFRLNVRLLRDKSVRFIAATIGTVYFFSVIVWQFLHIVSSKTMFNDLDYGSPLTCVFYYIMGIMCCDLYWLCKDTDRNLTAMEVAAIIAFFVWCLGRNSFLPMPDIWKHAVDVGICVILLGIFEFSGGSLSKKILKSGLLRELSKYSMYIYLGHYVLSTYIGGIMELLFDLNELAHNIIVKILTILLLFPLCYYMRKYDLKRILRANTERI